MKTKTTQSLASWLWEQIQLGTLCAFASAAIMTTTLVLLAGPTPAQAADKEQKLPPQELWITGDVFSAHDILFFRADKPVQGNSTGRVVLLGTSKQDAQSILPLLMKAAEKKMTLRLYGYLQPNKGGFPGYKGPKLPDVAFIVWKLHMPDDPDVLPPDQRIPIQ